MPYAINIVAGLYALTYLPPFYYPIVFGSSMLLAENFAEQLLLSTAGALLASLITYAIFPQLLGPNTRDPQRKAIAAIVGVVIFLAVYFWLKNNGSVMLEQLPTPTPRQEQPAPTQLSLSCKDVLDSSRKINWDLEPPCWGKLPDGAEATVVFHRKVIVTGWSEGGVYVFTADPGNTESGLKAATFRPVDAGWSKDEVIAIESSFHAPNGENPACVRDKDNGDAPISGTDCP
ncbi:MAG: hypothetical protein WCD37_16585 [Chloroflexia bacterium]